VDEGLNTIVGGTRHVSFCAFTRAPKPCATKIRKIVLHLDWQS